MKIEKLEVEKSHQEVQKEHQIASEKDRLVQERIQEYEMHREEASSIYEGIESEIQRL